MRCSNLVRASVISVTLCAVLTTTATGARFTPTTTSDDSPAGPYADTCASPRPDAAAATSNAQPQPVAPGNRSVVSLPAVSLLGAHNDLPTPFRPGVHWGELPPGRKWGSTASVTRAPDGTIWVVDRCGTLGTGGTACA